MISYHIMSSLYSYSSGSQLGVICSVSNACVCVCVCVWSSTTNIGLVEARDLLNILQCPEQTKNCQAQNVNSAKIERSLSHSKP